MKAFIFERVAQCSRKYHPEGGVFIVAKSKGRAIKLIEETEYLSVTSEEWGKAIEYCLEGHFEERIIIFPDAGCC